MIKYRRHEGPWESFGNATYEWLSVEGLEALFDVDDAARSATIKRLIEKRRAGWEVTLLRDVSGGMIMTKPPPLLNEHQFFGPSVRKRWPGSKGRFVSLDRQYDAGQGMTLSELLEGIDEAIGE